VATPARRDDGAPSLDRRFEIAVGRVSLVLRMIEALLVLLVVVAPAGVTWNVGTEKASAAARPRAGIRNLFILSSFSVVKKIESRIELHHSGSIGWTPKSWSALA